MRIPLLCSSGTLTLGHSGVPLIFGYVEFHDSFIRSVAVHCACTGTSLLTIANSNSVSSSAPTQAGLQPLDAMQRDNIAAPLE